MLEGTVSMQSIVVGSHVGKLVACNPAQDDTKAELLHKPGGKNCAVTSMAITSVFAKSFYEHQLCFCRLDLVNTDQAGAFAVRLVGHTG